MSFYSDLVHNNYYNKDITVVETIIPSIPTGSRIVHKVEFTNKKEVDKAFIGFKFANTFSASFATSSCIPPTNTVLTMTNESLLGDVLSDTIQNTFLVYDDPEMTLRMNPDRVYAGQEKNVLGQSHPWSAPEAAVSRKYPASYTDLGNMLVGYFYYSFTGDVQGALYTGSGVKVIMEGMWFTKDKGNSLILNIALKNIGTTQSIPRTTQVHLIK